VKITRLSENQKFVFRWWTARELSDYDGIICDGAVRSGKTFCLSASFMTWAMTNFDEIDCFVCIDFDENVIARETWNGHAFIKDEDFDKKLAEIKAKSKGMFATILDIHN